MILSDCKQEVVEVFGKTNTERNNKILRQGFFSLKYFFNSSLNCFFHFNDDYEDDKFTLGDAV